MTSYNMLLRLELSGYEPRAEAALVAGLTALWQRESDDLADAMGGVHPLACVEGGTMLVSGSWRPVIIVNPSRWDPVIEARLRAVVEPLVPWDAELRFAREIVGEDDSRDEALTTLLHHVRSANGEQVEALRGSYRPEEVPKLCAEYVRMPAWAQREELIHLLMDASDPALEPVHRDFLRAPWQGGAGEPYQLGLLTALGSLYGLDGETRRAIETDAALALRGIAAARSARARDEVLSLLATR